MLSAIGNTPVVRLSRIVPSGAADVWVKLEYYNPTGSYKDRMALSMIERAEQRGRAQARHDGRRIHRRQHLAFRSRSCAP
jgi:cysteine synthase